ncbi:Uncharacterised protein [Enterobacter cancerogenus]|uniref:Uncharacterized protein n=1 Tax=Enterobacter cancerogenus TaxID=69218 RepID=A0A484ZBJ7_9ENTR|nr:Uncharacterised protein [Enterobacter cancerogenus]
MMKATANRFHYAGVGVNYALLTGLSPGACAPGVSVATR